MVGETVKLFYLDSHMAHFEATVLECAWDERKGWYGVVLDRTAFFPEGGGQYADSGVLGGVMVEDVKERDGVVVHYVGQALEPGAVVTGEIDYEERFSKMQQHTGEHIVSGLVHRRFGYDNVGFHLGKELVTMDFNGTFTEEELCEVELEANRAVTANLPVEVTYPTREALDAMEYRSKKELSGQVRIVTVPGYDVCACCAPHVALTGEIGMIRLVEAVKYKGGTRVTMVCGFRALQDYRMKEGNVKEISRLLSAKACDTAEAVRHLQGELQQMKDKLIRTQTRYLDQKLEEIAEGTGDYLLFEPELDKNAARRFVDAGMHRCSGICGMFLGNEEQGYHYILGSQSVNLREFLKEFHQEFPGKGGGKPEMVQGSIRGPVSCEGIRTCLCKCRAL